MSPSGAPAISFQPRYTPDGTEQDGELLEVSLGPQHPSTHGVFRMDATLDGEKVVRLKPRRLKTCVLLEQKARRSEKVRADYVGFQIPDLFVVGYGLDYAERYRNLPFVGVLKPEIYRT